MKDFAVSHFKLRRAFPRSLVSDTRGTQNLCAKSDGSPLARNGLSGNPHFATKAIGKDLAEIGITNTVNQVKKLLAGQ